MTSTKQFAIMALSIKDAQRNEKKLCRKTKQKTEETNMEKQTPKGVPGFVPLIALAAAVVAIALYAFLPALSIDGRNYVGWMVTFYYWGHQYIYHYHEFGFNLVLSLATVLPVVLTIITLAMWKHGSAQKRMVLSMLDGAALIFTGIAYLNVMSLAESTVSQNIELTLKAAQKSGTFLKGTMPTIAAVVCFAVAVVMIATGILNKKAGIGGTPVVYEDDDDDEDEDDD